MTRLNPIIFVCFLVLLGTGCTLGNVSPNDEVILETLVAQTVLTAAAEAKEIATLLPIPTETATPLLPTVVPTLVPSLTPTEISIPVRFIDDPGNLWGKADLSDTFDTDDRWITFEGEDTSLTIQEGELWYRTTAANNTPSWRFSYLKVQDVYLEFLARTPENCEGNDRFGLVFRSPNYDDGYFLGFNCQFQYALYKFENGRNHILVPWKNSDLIDTTPTGYNRIGIWMDNDFFVVHINGVQLDAVNDSSFRSGFLGVWVASENTPNFTARFEEINFWVIP